nr:MAG TPA: hypothetical protein [Bacteriophage sp.]DAW87914.1 MAG TPA: hypothetical protein [Bacteriophage sp.]
MQNVIRQKRSFLRARFSAALGFCSLRKKVFDLAYQLTRRCEIILIVEVTDSALRDFHGRSYAALDECVRVFRGILSSIGGVDVEVSQVRVPRKGDTLKLVIHATDGDCFSTGHRSTLLLKHSAVSRARTMHELGVLERIGVYVLHTNTPKYSILDIIRNKCFNVSKRSKPQ